MRVKPSREGRILVNGFCGKLYRCHLQIQVSLDLFKIKAAKSRVAKFLKNLWPFHASKLLIFDSFSTFVHYYSEFYFLAYLLAKKYLQIRSSSN